MPHDPPDNLVRYGAVAAHAVVVNRSLRKLPHGLVVRSWDRLAFFMQPYQLYHFIATQSFKLIVPRLFLEFALVECYKLTQRSDDLYRCVWFLLN